MIRNDVTIVSFPFELHSEILLQQLVSIERPTIHSYFHFLQMNDLRHKPIDPDCKKSKLNEIFCLSHSDEHTDD